jgi:hypothetical protein
MNNIFVTRSRLTSMYSRVKLYNKAKLAIARGLCKIIWIIKAVLHYILDFLIYGSLCSLKKAIYSRNM